MGKSSNALTGELRTSVIELSDTANPCLMMRYVPPRASTYTADDTTHTIEIDNDGGAGSTLRMILTDDDGANNVDGATYTTLAAFVNQINGLGIGFEAVIKDCVRDYPMNTNDFIDLASVALSTEWTNVLYRDASEITTSFVRLALPNVWNGHDNGRIQLNSIQGYADSDSATDCVIRVIRDPGPLAANETTVFQRNVPDATETTLWDWSTNDVSSRPTLRGPVVVEVVATTSLATDLRVAVNWHNGDV